jgi:hypothetical protein
MHVLSISACIGLLAVLPVAAETMATSTGRVSTVIVAEADVLNAAGWTGAEPAWRSPDPAAQRARLRDSISDLRAILHTMTGREIPAVSEAPAPHPACVTILLGHPARARFGPPAMTSPHGQAFRLVARDGVIAVSGESDLAVSYGIYTLLDRLGCRWLMPGPLGAVIPERPVVTLEECDISLAPDTVFRGWDGMDEAFARRTRCGGILPADPAPGRRLAAFPGDPAAPYPLLGAWSDAIAGLRSNDAFHAWYPAAALNLEHTFPGHALALRLAWDGALDPVAEVRDLFERFYGAAAQAMRLYWYYVDQIWDLEPDASDGGYAHLRRWPAGALEFGKLMLARAAREADTRPAAQRVEMASWNYALFSDFLTLRRRLADGDWDGLEHAAETYLARLRNCAARYRPAPVFGGHPDSTYEREFNRRYRATFTAASRLARDHAPLTPEPIRTWRWRFEPSNENPNDAWGAADVADAAWPATDTCLDTWATLGHGDDLGVMWYRARVVLDAPPTNAPPARLWIGATDGAVRVFVNGRPCPALLRGNRTAPEHTGFSQPARFAIEDAVRPGTNIVAVRCERTTVNARGASGILGAPAACYR